jgi:hypothetical protein
MVEGFRCVNERHGEVFLAMTLEPGYNCRGYCWVSEARVEAVHDTGASRNSIDKDFLKALVNLNEHVMLLSEYMIANLSNAEG